MAVNIITEIKDKKYYHWPWIVVLIILFLLLAGWLTDLALKNMYQDKLLKGISVAGIDIGNLSLEEARSRLDKRIDFVSRRGFVYTAAGKTVTIYPSISTMESADSIDLIVSWNTDETLAKVEDFNKNTNLFWRIVTLLKGRDFALSYNWDREQHQEIMMQSFQGLLSDKQEADFYFDDQDSIHFTPEQAGRTFDYHQAMAATQKQIETLISTDIELTVIEDPPLITQDIIRQYQNDIVALVGRGDFVLTFDDNDYEIPEKVWLDWLTIKQGGNGFYVGLDQDEFSAYLTESGIKDEVERPVKDAKFDLSQGRVAEFVSSQPGRSIDIVQTTKQMETVLKNRAQSEPTVAISIVTVEPKVQTKDVNDLGIVEIIGTGESDFSGSPVNRVHNIGVGADTLHGVLIEPDEEFSLITNLGEIDGEHGYRQELVIKGDKTIPEYGGGLCQIGTTMFRAALASGLPVTERRNHSYRVPYYEPAGTDATIYNPWPDLKFKNDTGHYILIQARIEGNELYFDFWGTKDGRVVMMTEPEVYNIVSPPEKKIIKTTDLEPGQTRCTERAHYGADAKFDYSVQYPDAPEPVETTFYSHYVPWQEVCLLGVTEEELLAEQAAGENATSTPAQ